VKIPKPEIKIYEISDLPVSIEDLFHHPTLTDPNCSKFLDFFKAHHLCFFDKVFLKPDWQTTLLAQWK
jgi:hypothetical protein